MSPYHFSIRWPRKRRKKCACIKGTPLRILSPANHQTIFSLETIQGAGMPHAAVQIIVNDCPALSARADGRGNWSAANPYRLTAGPHKIVATQKRNCYGRRDEVCFRVETPEPLPPPAIDSPANGSVTQNRRPVISGRAVAENSVMICVGGYRCLSAAARPDGTYQIRFPSPLSDGAYTITATQRDARGRVSPESQIAFTVQATKPPATLAVETHAEGAAIDPSGKHGVQFACKLADGTYAAAVQTDALGNESVRTESVFQVATAKLRLETLSIQMGERFRSVQIEFAVSGLPGPITVYYLMLPPASPAPTTADMTDYPNAAALESGAAARGLFSVDVSGRRSNVVRSISGKELASPLPGETGAIDGYVYDVYLYAEGAQAAASGVTAFGSPAMAAPFDGGSGSQLDPYRLRELTREEIRAYPDLQATGANNDAGVDQTARMLYNIERLEALYDQTNGVYGADNSLARHYLLASSFDLRNYAAAYGGDGWRPIGDCDANRFKTGPAGRRVFTGSLSGGESRAVIANLPLTPRFRNRRRVEFVGLIGAARGARVERIDITNAVVAPHSSDDAPTLRAGALVALADNCAIENIRLRAAAMSFDDFGNCPSRLKAGGIVGELSAGRVSGVAVENVKLTGSRAAYNYLGGVAGFARGAAPSAILDCAAAHFTLSGIGESGAHAGAIVGLLLADGPFVVSNIRVDDAHIEGHRLIGGGAIGCIRANAEVTLQDFSIQNARISSGADGCSAAGAVGDISARAPLTVSSLKIDASKLSAICGCGGLVGRLSLRGGANVNIFDFTVAAQMSAAAACCGGAVGFVYREGASPFYLRDGQIDRTATVFANSNAGGLVGKFYHPAITAPAFFERCASAAIVRGGVDGRCVGGLFGTASHLAIRSLRFAGSASGADFTGGIAGDAVGFYAEHCSCSGSISGSSIVGGLFGRAFGSIAPGAPTSANAPFNARPNFVERSSMRGNVRADESGIDVGALVGTLSGMRIEQCFALAELSPPSSGNIGLLVGASLQSADGLETSIADSYSVGTISGESCCVGGCAGLSEGAIRRCYCAGSISGDSFVGGVAGLQDETAPPVSGCFTLGPLVAGKTSSAARTANGPAENNYALGAAVLIRGGEPAEPATDPNGPDGMTIAPDELVRVMTASGWNAAIWNFDSIAALGRPTLVSTPE